MTPTRMLGVGAFLLGTVAGGAIGLSGLANAASDDTTSTTATTVVDSSASDTTDDTTDETADTNGAGEVPAGPHTANGITEEELTGDAAAGVQAAVLAAYPDATIDRMETDAEGAAYEAHITLADGSRVTVTLDEAFTVTGTEAGPGGDCGPGHGPRPADDTVDDTEDVTADTSTTS